MESRGNEPMGEMAYCMASGSKPKILVSMCLLGNPCRFDGQSKPDVRAKQLHRHFDIVPVCPELYGGLKIPRTPSERNMLEGGDKVVSKDGEDRTEAFRIGSEKTLAKALEHGCRLAVLKAKSPSCGVGKVYDGTFTGTLVEGDGVGAALLKSHGIRVIDETDLERLSVAELLDQARG